METNIPKIGVAVIIKKCNCVLLGKRKNSHGNNTWGFPWWSFGIWRKY